jgi:hypothetical protein
MLTVGELLKTKLLRIDALPTASGNNELTLLLRPQAIGLQALKVVEIVEKGRASA